MIPMEYEDIIQRNIGVLDWEEQKKLRHVNISFLGLCDQGISPVLAAKIGFNKVNLIDCERVEINNLNSQFFATIDRISQNKTDVAKDVVRKHNPLVDCSTLLIDDAVTTEMIKESLGDSHYFIISTKNPYLRILASRAAEESDIPYIVCMDMGFKVFLAVFAGDTGFEKLTKQPSLGKKLTGDLYTAIYHYQLKFLKAVDALLQNLEVSGDAITKSIPIASHFVANLSIAEVVKMVIGKGKIHYAPCNYTMDLLTWKPWDLSEAIERIQ